LINAKIINHQLHTIYIMESQSDTKKCPKCGAEMELIPIGRTMTYRCEKCGNEEKMVTL
jgi:tRNA(Ile2) C34 agmatinyltransferase TiaS